jgi:lipopolysaccharide/colanic/teichoic acid biosynthesis glycosyltransferase
MSVKAGFRKRLPLYFRFITRTLDLVLGMIGLLFSIPLIVAAAIAVRWESPGNPFFVQERVGLVGRRFRIFKLRGMYADARERFPNLYDYQKFGTLGFYFHYENDPRVTRVGSFIRKTSIDELPNFLNVILGSMTLVGPRPEVPEVEALYGAYSAEYLSVKPGITCLSKVSGRDTLTKEESIRIDLGYVRNMSLPLNFRILYYTVKNVIGRRNVFNGRRVASDIVEAESHQGLVSSARAGESLLMMPQPVPSHLNDRRFATGSGTESRLSRSVE